MLKGPKRLSLRVWGKVFSTISRLARVGGYEDEEESYKANLLNRVLWMAVAANLLIALVVVEWAQANPALFLLQWLALFLVAGGGILLLRLGQLLLASRMVIYVTWLAVTLRFMVTAGFNDSGFFGLLALLAVSARLFLTRRDMIVVIALDVLSFVLWLFSARQGWFDLSDLELYRNALDLSAQIISLVMLVGLLIYASQGIQMAFGRARQSERQYQALFDQTNDAVILYGLDLVCQGVNQKAVELLGYREKELVGNSIMLFVPDDEQHDTYRKTNALLAGGRQPLYKRRLRTKGGKEVLVEVDLTLVKDEIGLPRRFQAILRDITRQEHARQELHDSEARYRSLFEESPAAMWEEDFSQVKLYIDQLRDAGVADLRAYLFEHPEEVQHITALIKVININQATREMYGYLPVEQFYDPKGITVVEEGVRLMREEFLAFAEGASRFEEETFHLAQGGRQVFTLVRASIPPGLEHTWERVLISVLDITSVKQTETIIRDSELQYRTTMDAFSEAIFVVDRDLRVVLVNAAYRDWLIGAGFAYDPVGANLLETHFFLSDTAEEEYCHVFESREMLVSEQVLRIYERETYLETYKIPIIQEGEVVQVVTMIRDITERRELEDRLRTSLANMANLSRTDPLTELFNRRAMVEYAQAELSRAQRSDTPTSLILLDMDFLKLINDKYGHQSGDDALILLADTLQRSKRRYDWAGRWGGDEFFVVLPDAGIMEGKEVLQRLQRNISEASFLLPDGTRQYLSVSIGLACTHFGNTAEFDLDKLLSWTDQALYEAKQSGRNQFRIYGVDVFQNTTSEEN